MITAFLKDVEINVLNLRPQSPDLNIPENVLANIKRKREKRRLLRFKNFGRVSHWKHYKIW